MNSYTVIIHDITSWATTIRAPGSIQAENIALDLYGSPQRTELFEKDDDTTVQVHEVQP